jgi:transposase InsO family protein
MSRMNPLWGAPRIHGELLKLGFEVAQSTVAKYMVRRLGPPSQGWKTFLRNHVPHIGAIDMFVVPTVGFRLLYGLVILRLHRRHLVWINVTSNPTADWIARQITEAFPWDQAPRYLIRDRDASYGHVVTRRLAAMGIRDRPTAPHSPWQNSHVERLIGSIRRECLDHVLVLGEGHLRRILKRICELLQRTENPPIPRQRHPAPSRHPATRHRHLAPDPWRPAPSILPNLIFGTHRRIYRTSER